MFTREQLQTIFDCIEGEDKSNFEDLVHIILYDNREEERKAAVMAMLEILNNPKISVRRL